MDRIDENSRDGQKTIVASSNDSSGLEKRLKESAALALSQTQDVHVQAAIHAVTQELLAQVTSLEGVSDWKAQKEVTRQIDRLAHTATQRVKDVKKNHRVSTGYVYGGRDAGLSAEQREAERKK